MSLNNSSTHSFKSLNRQKPPAWSNRFRKDVNDLMYYPKDLRDIQYAKKSPNHLSQLKQKKYKSNNSPMKNAMDKYNVQLYDSSNKIQRNIQRSYSTKNTLDFQPSKSTELFHSANKYQENPQFSQLKNKIYKNPKNQNLFHTTDALFKRNQSLTNLSARIQSSNKYGLSNFEFATKTIQGKIHAKPSHHLNLSKSQTQKINNLNPIYYNKDEDIILHEHEKRKFIDTLKKYRNFKSYSSHNLYAAKEGVGKGGLLDKFYEVKQYQLDLVRKKIVQDIDIEKISPRPGLPKKLGTHLYYPNSYIEISKLNTNRPLYEVQTLKRNLIIPKQIISDKRGSYR